jgi:hypothetical protein
MAKLYWRVKRNGKWTWKPATVTGWTTDGYGGYIVEPEGGQMEEEEFLRFLEDEQNTSATRTSEGTAADDFAEEEQ